MRLSIRWRLTLWNTLALALVLAGFAALVYVLLAHSLYRQVDRKLLSGFHELEHDERLQSDPDGQMRHWAYELFEHEGVFCVVYGPGGEPRPRPPSRPRRDRPKPAPGCATRRSPSSDGNASWRGRCKWAART